MGGPAKYNNVGELRCAACKDYLPTGFFHIDKHSSTQS